MIMIKGYEDGADISILNCMYQYPQKHEDGKWDKGCIIIIYYDQITKEIKKEEIENPDYEFYIAKKGIHFDNTQFFVSRNDVDKVTCSYRELDKKVAELTGQLDIYKENMRNGNRRENYKLHFHPDVFNSDLHIEDMYKQMFDRKYKNEPIPKITKAFFDIEYDGSNYHQEGIDREGHCPINAISYINEADKRVYVYLLRNSENPLIEIFEEATKSPELHEELKRFIQKEVGGWKQEKRYGLDEYSYKFMFYDEDDEIQLIHDFYTVIHYWKPNFINSWNGSDFDNTYIRNRICVLGYEPIDIMCCPDFKHKLCRIYVDQQLDKNGKAKEFAERGDYIALSSYSVWLDQMIQFASRRKGQSKFQKMSLDYIGEAICNVKKLDYSHITNKIHELPYKDYKTFVFYNIMDTIVQFCIDKKTGDTEYVYTKALMNNVRYSKVHRQTTYQTNRMSREFYNYYEDGLILGNNANVINQKPTEKYPGAYVADPLKLNDYSRVSIHGKPTNICKNVVDYDYSAQYPNAVREHNMAPHTQIAKIIIEQIVFKNENPFNTKYYTRGGSFLEDHNTKNLLEFCCRWFHLASYSELIDDITEYFNYNMMYMYNPRPFVGNMRNIMRRCTGDSPKRQIMVRDNPEDKRIVMLRNYIPDYSLASKINVDEIVYNAETRYIKLTTAEKNARAKDDE